MGSGHSPRLSYAERSHGGRSSARLERQVVALEVGGSSPLGHPIVVMVVRRKAGDHRTAIHTMQRHPSPATNSAQTTSTRRAEW